MSKLRSRCPKLETVSDVRAECPKLGQGVRSQGKVSEVRVSEVRAHFIMIWLVMCGLAGPRMPSCLPIIFSITIDSRLLECNLGSDVAKIS